MTGRVQQIHIDFWSQDELREIASRGFRALNLLDEAGAIGDRLAEESFASPYLMQDFCKKVVRESGFEQRQESPSLLQVPLWQPFFYERAGAASKPAFNMLASGPRQRSDRKSRKLKNGTVVDIYGAVLMAIAHTGPLVKLPYETLRYSLKEVVDSDPPQRHEVTRILEEMSKIARKNLEGEPVVDYDGPMSELHISDPYFAFFLKWRAAHELHERSKGLMPTLAPLLSGPDREATSSGPLQASSFPGRSASERAPQWQKPSSKRKTWKRRGRRGKR